MDELAKTMDKLVKSLEKISAIQSKPELIVKGN